MPSMSTDKNGLITYAGIHEHEWQEWAHESDNINMALRGESLAGQSSSQGGGLLTDKEQKDMKDLAGKIQSAAEKYSTPKEVVYRGVSYKTEKELLSKFKVGSEIEAHGLTSTADDLVIAEDYAKGFFEDGYKAGAVIEYRSNTGHRGVFTAPFHQNEQDPHGEFVLPKGATYRVDSVTKGKDGMHKIVMSPVGRSKIDSAPTPKGYKLVKGSGGVIRIKDESGKIIHRIVGKEEDARRWLASRDE